MAATSSLPAVADPFDLALIRLLTRPSGTWQTPDLDTFTQTEEKALTRLAQAGLTEERWDVAATMRGFPRRGRILCRVTGDYGELLKRRIFECFPEWLTPDGKSVDWLTFYPDFCGARLTVDGETAKQDFQAGQGGRVLLHLRGLGERPGRPVAPSVKLERFWTEAAATEPAGDGEAGQAAAKAVDGSVTWQAAAESLERLRTNGDQFTDQRDCAKRLGCSLATVNKAVQRTLALQEWARRPVSSTQWAASLDGAALDGTPQSREPDPAGLVESPDVDAALAYLLDQAAPEERARIHALDPAARRQLAELAYRDPDLENRILGRED